MGSVNAGLRFMRQITSQGPDGIIRVLAGKSEADEKMDGWLNCGAIVPY